MTHDRTPNLDPAPVGVAPNGARRTHAQHPALPMTARELAHCAAQCVEAGASWFHVHVRDDSGGHTLDPARYRDAFDAIRAEVGDALLLQMTTEAVGRYSPQQQMDAVRAVEPEAVSVAVRELLPQGDAPTPAEGFLADLHACGTAVQYIAYNPGDLERLGRFFDRLGPRAPLRPEILLVLGAYAEQRDARPVDLLPMLGALQPSWGWSVCAFGPAETACLGVAAALGAGVRIGFENNLWLPDGRSATDNAELVTHLVGVLAGMGIRPATARQTRQRFLGHD